MKKSPYQRKEFIVRSNALRFLTDNKCKICDTKHEVTECHHIDGNPYNNAIKNLVILCPLHHKMVHLSNFAPETLQYNIPLLLLDKYEEALKLCEIAVNLPLQTHNNLVSDKILKRYENDNGLPTTHQTPDSYKTD